MKKITINTRIRQNKDILVSSIDEEKVMLSIEKGLYFGLNPTGSQLYDLLEEPITVSSLIDKILAQYDVNRESCENDVLAFLEDLYQRGIVCIEQ